MLLVFVRFGDFDGLLPLNAIQPLPLLRVSVGGAERVGGWLFGC